MPEVAEDPTYGSGNALTFVNHEDVRADVIRVDTELHGIKFHDQIVENYSREKKLKNKGGKTAVSILRTVKSFCTPLSCVLH